MRFLLIHTAGAEGSVALAEGGMVIAAEMLPGRTSSERLVPAVRRLLEENEQRLRDMTAIVVVHGPGSFTGVRVGLSAAKGLSEASGVRLIGVSRLALLASLANEASESVYAVLDAGRGEYYFGEYAGRRCVGERLLSGEEVAEAVSDGVMMVCEGKVAEALAGLHPRIVDEPTAMDALPFGVERAEAHKFDDAGELDANYLRRTDFEIFAKDKAGSAVG